jgi:prolyl oligopeptidase
MVERPDLFGAVVLSSSLTNVLRAETTANGRANVEEFGSLATARGFRSLRRMDLYHNLQPSAIYPPVLITAGMNDSRVPPWMSAKIAARLGECRRARGRVLLRIDWDGGHVVARSRAHDHARLADIYAFLLRHIGRDRGATSA